jgi:hypothetical protein
MGHNANLGLFVYLMYWLSLMGFFFSSAVNGEMTPCIQTKFPLIHGCTKSYLLELIVYGENECK